MAKRTKTIAVTVKAIAESCGYESAHPNTDGSQLQLIKGYTSVLLSIEETQKLLLKIAGSEFKGVTPTTPGLSIKLINCGSKWEDFYWALTMEEEFNFFND